MRKLTVLALLSCGVPPSEIETETPPMGEEVALPAALPDRRWSPPAKPTPTHADGTLEAWQLVTRLPIPRANHCAVAVGGELLVAGGNYRPAGSTDFITLDDVQLLTATGTWVRAGTLPSPGTECVLASSGRVVVLLGGLFND